MKRGLALIAMLSVSLSIEAAGAGFLPLLLPRPEPRHHAGCGSRRCTDLGNAPLELRMSRSSPGRYSPHDFAKNVYDVHASAAGGGELPATRPDPCDWSVDGHGGSVTVKLPKVYGDRVDGTYRRRRDACAHQHAGGDHVGTGLDDRPCPSPSRSRPADDGGWRRSCTRERRRSSSPRPTSST
jgi:hypothetical protein